MRYPILLLLVSACSSSPTETLSEPITRGGVLPSDAQPLSTVCAPSDGGMNVNPLCTLIDGAVGQTVVCTIDGSYTFEYCQ